MYRAAEETALELVQAIGRRAARAKARENLSFYELQDLEAKAAFWGDVLDAIGPPKVWEN